MRATLAAPGVLAVCTLVLAGGCSRRSDAPAADGPGARNLVMVTIDTLRADRVGAYGYAPARTPAIDSIAARGVRFNRAFATAPITLVSHASLMTGRYPPRHSGRHNGMKVADAVPTLAERSSAASFATGAFVAAFPLDRRFGLARGFDAYGDRMPPGTQGRPANDRAGREVVDEAIAWLRQPRAQRRFFLWVHLFEPHSPYGNPADRRPVVARYDDEVAEADRQVARLLGALGTEVASTLLVIASDHGEAFGEHGEVGHSVFVYDTTLRVPLVIAGPSIQPRVVEENVALVDVAPTVASLLGIGTFDADGVDLEPVLRGQALGPRDLYAESFAPLLDFGWSSLRTIRTARLKYIAAPKPELYDLAADPSESTNTVNESRERADDLHERVARISPASLDAPAVDTETARRLQALGYVSGRPNADKNRADPKDRRELAARLARVASGELRGPALEAALREILTQDPGNPQGHLRLGYVLADSGRCSEAEPHFRAAIGARAPTADAHLGLAGCFAAARAFDRAAAVLREGAAIEPDNPVVIANQGIVLSDGGRPRDAIPVLTRALALEPDFHEARFNLALAYAEVGQREDAAREAGELLRRLPAGAPQRAEVQRLLAAVR